MFITTFIITLPLNPILHHMNPVQTITPCILKICLKNITSSQPCTEMPLLVWFVSSKSLPSSGPHLAGYLKLLIEYICRYPPHLDVLSSFCNLKTYPTAVTMGNNNINIRSWFQSHINEIFACCLVIGMKSIYHTETRTWAEYVSQ